MKHISTGSPFEAQMGYSRAVVKGGWCFVSGTTRYDYARMVMPERAEDQARNCFETVFKVLREAGFAPTDVVRVQYTVADRSIVAAVTPVLGEYLGAIRPAARMVVAGLIQPEMLIEVEVTAFKG